MQGWNQRHLSPGGKEVLLKSVALAMPIFSVNLFRLPKEVCEEINSVLARFWWGSGDKKEYTGMLGSGFGYQKEKEDLDSGTLRISTRLY